MANEFLPFGTGGGANVLSQADYAALAERQVGFVSGVAKSPELNKVWRQSSFVAAALAQYVSERAQVDVPDDGDLRAFVNKLVDALAASPALTGAPTAPTPALDDASARIATTAFVQGLLAAREMQAGTVFHHAGRVAPAGSLEADGRAVAVASYEALTRAIYVGDGLNASAPWGYRCSNPAAPGSSRTPTGAHIVLPDLRGEFVRGWDNGRSVDPARSFGSAQADMFAAHRHGLSTSVSRGASGLAGLEERVPFISNEYDPQTVSNGGSETRPRNVALLACIKF